MGNAPKKVEKSVTTKMAWLARLFVQLTKKCATSHLITDALWIALEMGIAWPIELANACTVSLASIVIKVENKKTILLSLIMSTSLILVTSRILQKILMVQVILIAQILLRIRILLRTHMIQKILMVQAILIAQILLKNLRILM